MSVGVGSSLLLLLPEYWRAVHQYSDIHVIQLDSSSSRLIHTGAKLFDSSPSAYLIFLL